MHLHSKVGWNLRLSLKYFLHIHQFLPKFKANLRFDHRLYLPEGSYLLFLIYTKFPLTYNMPIWLINSIFLIFWPNFGHFPKFCPENCEKWNAIFFFFFFFAVSLFLYIVQDGTPEDLTSGAVYKLQCGLCNEPYYGECVRHLNDRIGEQIDISPLTKKTS